MNWFLWPMSDAAQVDSRLVPSIPHVTSVAGRHKKQWASASRRPRAWYIC